VRCGLQILLMFLIVAGQALAQRRGAVSFESSDRPLARGFQWAKNQALAYVFTGDAVGDWYEASLPGRQAFCMRDVSHQSLGAQVLGLAPLTRNMLHKFAENIADSRDWCSYWEIDKSNRPAPVDYKNDKDFWYNLPANFDILTCCYRQYVWTRDVSYIRDPAFLNFYDRTVSDYVKRWDKDGDGVPESYKRYGHRGIGSYDEDLDSHVLVGADLVAAQAAAYRAYAAIQDLRNNPSAAAEYRGKADKLKAWFNDKWWDERNQNFYRAMNQDRAFVSRRSGSISELWFGISEPGVKTERALDGLQADNIEVRSYFPEIAYRYGRNEFAYAALTALTDPALKRREYPEVSFAVIGAIAEGLMGIRPDCASRVVETLPHLTPRTEWAALRNVPVFENEITVRHVGLAESTFTNSRGPDIQWKASFPGTRAALLVDGRKQNATSSRTPEGLSEAYVLLRVNRGQSRTVRALP
jgi:hypothetical protein